MNLPQEVINLVLINILDNIDESYLETSLQSLSVKNKEAFISEIKRSSLDVDELLLESAEKGKVILFTLLADVVDLLSKDDLLEHCIYASFRLREGLKTLKSIFNRFYPSYNKDYLSIASLYGHIHTVKYLYEKLGFHRPPLLNVDLGLQDKESEMFITVVSLKNAILGSEEEKLPGKHYHISRFLFNTGFYEEYEMFSSRFPDDRSLPVILVKDSFDEDEASYDSIVLRQLCEHLKGNRENTVSDLYMEWPHCCEEVLRQTLTIGNEIGVFNEENYNLFKGVVRKLLREEVELRLDPSLSRERFTDFISFFTEESPYE